MHIVQLAPLTAVDPVFNRALGGDIEWGAVAKAICPALTQDLLSNVLDELADARKAIPTDTKPTRSKSLGLSDAYRAVETVLRDAGYEVKSPFITPPLPVLPPLASRLTPPPQARTVRDEMQAQDPLTLLPEDERRLLEEHRTAKLRATVPSGVQIKADVSTPNVIVQTHAGSPEQVKAAEASMASILGQDADAPARAAGAEEEKREHGQPPTVLQSKKGGRG